MLIAPDARVDDGLFDVIVFREFSLFELLYTFPKVFSGKHIYHPKVDVYRGRSIAVSPQKPQNILADGEIVGQTPVRFTCLPHSLKIRIS